MKTMKFDAQSTLLIKGIAIILMICNHLFPIPEWIYPENQFISLPLRSKTLAAYFGGFSKICVALFAFLTGIAMYHTYSQKSIGRGYKHTLKKLIPFFMTYWLIIICIYIPVMVFAGLFTFDIGEFILNLMGYINSYCKISWYVHFYLELVLTFPIIVRIINTIYRKSNNIELSIIVILAINWLLRFTISHVSLSGIKYVVEYMNYLPIVVVGYYIAWTSVFERVASWLSKGIKKRSVLVGIYIIQFCCLFLIRGLLTGNDWFNVDVILVPIFIVSTWYLIKSMEELNIIKIIVRCLRFLGQYSLELWFLHAIFFIGHPLVQKIAYWPRLDIFILIWTILLLMPFAMIVQRFQRNITRKISVWISKL